MESLEFSDECNHQKIFHSIIEYLQNIGKINMIYIAINSENPFLDDSKLSLFKKISLLFGVNIFKNLVITFTNWSFLKRHENLRFK